MTERCEVCGDELAEGRRSCPKSACRVAIHRARRRVDVVRLCECGCGRALPVGSRSQRRWFSDACRMRAKRKEVA